MRVWFNRHFSVVLRVTRLLREAQLPITSIISHYDSHFSGFTIADETFVEPYGLSTPDYVEWCLEQARIQRIDWLVPGYEATALAEAEPRFAAAGIRMVNTTAAGMLPLLNQKDWVYQQAPLSVPRPRFVMVDANEQLEPAIAEIESVGPACIKPCVSVYGYGYHQLESHRWHVPAGGAQPMETLSLLTWRKRYPKPSPERRQLLMEYLPGAEYSIDLACCQGEVLAGVVRRKSLTQPVQSIEERADLLEYAAQLVAGFALHGLLNVQFKDAADGTPKLLEINTRASGGIAMSCLSGVNLPAIAYSACVLDQRLPVPTANFGLRVAEVPMAIVMPGFGPL